MPTSTSDQVEYLKRNRLLAALSPEDLERIKGDFQPIEVKRGDLLYDNGDRLKYIHFPVDCLISLLYITEHGMMAEIAIIGCDGMVGVAGILGGISTPHRAIAQSNGTLYRISVEDFCHEVDRADGLEKTVLRFIQALITQIAQTAVCNQFHRLDEQLCRWLLISHDRLTSDRIEMTHDMIATMIGVRREGVTVALKRLSNRGAIKTARGEITVVDRDSLESCACECYDVVANEYERLLNISRQRNADRR